MQNRNIIGLDTAKNVFQLHISDSGGKKIKGMRLRRDQLIEVFANLPPALVGLEACGGSHHWARTLEAMGHEVKVMAPQHVKPYVKGGNKSDSRDADAICEAASRPSVPSVRVKSLDQQQMQALHRTRELYMKQRIQISNQIRGLLAEFGIVVPKSYKKLLQAVPLWLSEEGNPGILSELVEELYSRMLKLDEDISGIEKKIKLLHDQCETSKLLSTIPGVGFLTATAIVAGIGDGSQFSTGRKFSSAMGLTPREYSSGDKRTQMGITKRGNSYIRKMLIHGARAVLASRSRNPKGEWIDKLLERRGFNIATVALASKNARRIWAMLRSGEKFDADREVMQRMKKAA